LKAFLSQMGIAPGDALIVHSSFESFEGFQGSVMDAIQILQEAVGADGALLMPTLPFSGSVIEYAQTNTLLDVKRTPSRMGMMSEMFRRLPDVRRSVHPTHATAGWGALSASLLDSHSAAATPCGEGSPFAGLLHADGKMLFLGVDINAMTFFHYLEEDLEAKMPFSPFTTETFTLSVRDEGGRVIPVAMRLYDPLVSRHRDAALMIPHLKRQGAWREAKIGGLNAIVLRCRDVRDSVMQMASQGLYCYHDVESLVQTENEKC
jgi:aminoglycoside 3-N-acetyltransferase